jgi:hypothetical protein
VGLGEVVNIFIEGAYMHIKLTLRLTLILAVATSLVSAQSQKHPLRLDDLARFRNVGDPQCSPDGQAVAYDHRYQGRQEQHAHLDDRL